MNKRNPTELADAFRGNIDDLLTFHAELIECAVSGGNQSVLASLVFHRAYVYLETFLSDWFTAAINRDSTVFRASREQKIRDSISSKFSAWDVGQLSYSPPAHLTLEQIGQLLDPTRRNTTFGSYSKFVEAANSNLAAPFATKVTAVPNNRRRILDAAKAIRNCISHQSDSSRDKMNQQLTSLPVTGNCGRLRRRVNAVRYVGSYLKSAAGSETRLEIYLHEFDQLALNLR